MTGDVFYQEIKSLESPRGSIVPNGARTEEINGENVLTIPAEITHVETPIIFPDFRIVVEGSELHVAGPGIEDAAIYGRTLEARQASVSAEKEIEVTGEIQATRIRGKTVRAEKISAGDLEAVLNVRATRSVIARTITVTEGGVRAPLLITNSLQGENLSTTSKTWTSGIADGDVPSWLQEND